MAIPILLLRRWRFSFDFGLGILVLLFGSLTNSKATSSDDQWAGDFFLPGEQGSVVQTLLLEHDGTLVFGGKNLSAEPGPTTALARLDGRQRSNFTSQISDGGVVYALAESGGSLYVGGLFTSIGGAAITNLARWDGTNWFAIGGGVSGGSVRAIAVTNDELFVAGVFNRAGPLSVNQIARWDGTNWTDMAGGLQSGVFSEAVSPVTSLIVVKGHLFVGGSFFMAGNVATTNIAEWDGLGWHSVGVGDNNGVAGAFIR